MKRIAELAVGLTLLALSLNAQQVRVFAGAGFAQNFEFMSAGMAMEGKLVKGAPYSADTSHESVQALADGNRIVHRSTTKVYRDSEGRTRREQTLDAIGPWAASGQPRQMIFINDPVAGVSYTLDPATKTARKLPVMKWSGSGTGGDFTFETHGPVVAGAAVGTGTHVVISRSIEHTVTGTSSANLAANPNVKKEELGTRSFEGVEAQGNRVTLTIPAGQMGNERPLDVVTESWYSPDLQLTVSSETRDPRMGNSTFRLSNISRAEQPRLLFEIPSDYTLQEETVRPATIRLKKEMM